MNRLNEVTGCGLNDQDSVPGRSREFLVWTPPSDRLQRLASVGPVWWEPGPLYFGVKKHELEAALI